MREEDIVTKEKQKDTFSNMRKMKETQKGSSIRETQCALKQKKTGNCHERESQNPIGERVLQERNREKCVERVPYVEKQKVEISEFQELLSINHCCLHSARKIENITLVQKLKT